jgi:four helix bundle protein
MRQRHRSTKLPRKRKERRVNPNEREGESRRIFDLGDRTLRFAQRMMDICERLPNTPECQRLRSQLGGAGMSVGANYEEGDGALTKAEKRKSFSVSRKEARESRFFLKVIAGRYLPEDDVAADIREAGELVNIFSSIIDKLS